MTTGQAPSSRHRASRRGGVSWDSAPVSNPDCPLEPVEPAEPLAPWLGGKKLLAKHVISRIEAVPHDCYAEPFCGMAGVFFRRARRPRAEVLNDINGDVVNLFRIVREHPDELMRQFKWTVASRAEFCRLVETPVTTLTDVQRAARFFYVQRLSFKGGLGERTPAFQSWGPSRLRADLACRLIAAAHARLQRVQVECMDWHAFIARYDKPFTLFYIDPPYWGHEADYGKGLFAQADFARLAQLLHTIQGRFILSLNDRPEVCETFAGFDFEEVVTTYTANSRAAKRAAELLISN